MEGVVSNPRPHVAAHVEMRFTDDSYAIYERHFREMVGLARLLVGDVATAEDIVHDATIRLHASIKRVRDPDRVVAYYRSIVLNLARNQLRGRSRKRAAESRASARLATTLKEFS
jgi:DNA-directed RNA polymerase specialized sigma24 family protein